MYVTAVLSPDQRAFVAWCRAQGYRVAGDGAESSSGKWLAIRILRATDLHGLEVDRVDYAPDFWRRGTSEDLTALEELARASTRRRSSAPEVRGPRG